MIDKDLLNHYRVLIRAADDLILNVRGDQQVVEAIRGLEVAHLDSLKRCVEAMNLATGGTTPFSMYLHKLAVAYEKAEVEEAEKVKK